MTRQLCLVIYTDIYIYIYIYILYTFNVKMSHDTTKKICIFSFDIQIVQQKFVCVHLYSTQRNNDSILSKIIIILLSSYI